MQAGIHATAGNRDMKISKYRSSVGIINAMWSNSHMQIIVGNILPGFPDVHTATRDAKLFPPKEFEPAFY
jgi:hypothetical protein